MVQHLARMGRNMVLARPLHAHMHLPMSLGTKFVLRDIALHETVLVLPRSLDVDFGRASWTLVDHRYLGARALCARSPSVSGI